LETLVSPYGPIAIANTSDRLLRGLRRVTCGTAYVGSGWPGFMSLREPVRAGGCAIDDENRARLIAIAEGAERYAAGDFLGEHRFTGTVSELSGAFLDPDRIPRCSENEQAVPGCPWRPFNPDEQTRWVRGIDLVTHRPTWLPAVMACYRLEGDRESERFWYRISTGHAVHFNPFEALLRAIYEIIERDIIAVLWLQQMPLPLVACQQVPERAERLIDWGNEHFLQTYLFDATTDMGVPTVYCLQVADYDDRAHQLVGCATGRTMPEATEKTLLETLRIRPVCYQESAAPEEPDAIADITDGMRYMARAQMASAFNFLTDGAGGRPAQERADMAEDPAEALDHILGVLDQKGMQVIAVDRTPQELSDAGLTSVAVVIPDLQPMSLNPLMQFRAHRRLYAAPASMGYDAHLEKDLNPWPQPFA
jgi:ribosomal protein S12 methylthiotransferase accessory factor